MSDRLEQPRPREQEDTWKQVMDLVSAALDLPAQQRHDFLAAHGGSDHAVVREAMAVIANPPAEGFLSRPDADGADSLSGQRLGSYRLVEIVGRGGTACVYRAERIGHSEIVAVKVLDSPLGGDVESLRRQLDRHAAVMARIDHPLSVQPIESQVDRGYAYLAMEFVEGRGLLEAAAELRSADPVEGVRAIVGWFVQLADRLAAVHAAGVLHCDIKPDNVLVSLDGSVRLVDFGVALLAGESQRSAPQGLRGTPGYLSPEQLRATRALASVQSDLYACGVVLGQALAAIGCEQPAVPAPWKGVPISLQRILSRALDPDPARRHSSARELAEELARAI